MCKILSLLILGIIFEKNTVRLSETIEYIPLRLKNKNMNDISFNRTLNDCKQYLPVTTY